MRMYVCLPACVRVSMYINNLTYKKIWFILNLINIKL